MQNKKGIIKGINQEEQSILIDETSYLYSTGKPIISTIASHLSIDTEVEYNHTPEGHLTFIKKVVDIPVVTADKLLQDTETIMPIPNTGSRLVFTDHTKLRSQYIDDKPQIKWMNFYTRGTEIYGLFLKHNGRVGEEFVIPKMATEVIKIAEQLNQHMQEQIKKEREQ